jgi:hypothetical protein
MEKELRVLYDDGVAIRSLAPSRASAACEGGGEASVGVVQAGVIEPRNDLSSGCRRRSTTAEGLVAGGASASRLGGPARSESLGMYEALLAGNREVPWSPVSVGDASPRWLGFAGWRRVRAVRGTPLAVSP